MHRALFIGLTLLLLGCGKTVPVDLTASAARDATFEPFQRFAVTHGAKGGFYSRQIARETANALQNMARRNDYTPLARQQLLTTSPEANQWVHQVASLTRRSFAGAGHSQSGRDPDIAVCVDFATGPFEYRTPDRPIANQAHGTRAGWLDRVHAHGVLMHIYDANRPDQPIWVGYAISINDEPEFARVAPALIEQLVRAYPHATRPVRRTVTLR
jgi:hypothetical protein